MDYKMLRNIGRRMKAYRLEHHMNVRAFGELVNRTGTWVSAMENCHYTQPSAERLQAIARAIGTDVRSLVADPPKIITTMAEEERRMGVRNLIKIWRRKKIGQNAFSLKIGMSAGFFGEVKRGTRLPNAASFNTIAARLGMPVETLIGRERK